MKEEGLKTPFKLLFHTVSQASCAAEGEAEGKMTSVQRKREQKRQERKRRILGKISVYGKDILHSSNFQSTRRHIQHGTVSVHSHCVSVAECSLQIRETLETLGIRSEERDLVRGALLHDYFLYDWHKHKRQRGFRNLHGFRHPETALENASREYELTDREREIIRKHMWPLTVMPPMCREAWIVTAADKYCSLMETLRLKNEQRSVRRSSKAAKDTA